ncbi:DUF3175 domain-containing protein [Dokdonella sp.]|uniref:DUF3175 domain-containing protein n=1 Tax=Dokdonella sp. TaxID=2291710 RepID=UPI001B12A3B8|nr:DUF3175 domain-containing protein [Dokdonella sp.]MBO9664103.1 DUF3175 domain-containing protein [Dokdonella sp.]
MAAARKRSPTHRWSARVTATSDALDLREGVFKLDDPKAIARSLKRSAERSHRRKVDPFRSAMSMLTFYINRAGANLPKRRRATLEQAKVELRKVRTRSAGSTRASHRASSRRAPARSGGSAR